MNDFERDAKRNAEELLHMYKRLKDDPRWIIVRRHAKDITARGEIIAIGMTEEMAKTRADKLATDHKDYFVWAMPAQNYFTPFAI